MTTPSPDSAIIDMAKAIALGFIALVMWVIKWIWSRLNKQVNRNSGKIEKFSSEMTTTKIDIATTKNDIEQIKKDIDELHNITKK